MVHMTTGKERVHHGLVLQWNADEGWGLIASEDFDGPIWVHFSNIEPPDRNRSPGGYRSLHDNDEVDFTAEPADQDGYRWRATLVRYSEGESNSEGTQP